jgi:hypothetical protein
VVRQTIRRPDVFDQRTDNAEDTSCRWSLNWIASKFCDGWKQLQFMHVGSMECDGRSADGVLFVNVSCATGAKQITIAKIFPRNYISLDLPSALPPNRPPSPWYSFRNPLLRLSPSLLYMPIGDVHQLPWPLWCSQPAHLVSSHFQNLLIHHSARTSARLQSLYWCLPQWSRHRYPIRLQRSQTTRSQGQLRCL